MSNVALLSDEHELVSYIDEYLFANNQHARVAGQTSLGEPFIAWLTDTAGVIVVVVQIEGASYGTFRGGPSILSYPVTVME